MTTELDRCGVTARPLTPREAAFCVHDVELGNATEAYKRAFGARPGTKESTHQVKACHKLADPRVRRRVRTLQDQAAELAVCSAAQTLRELARVAMCDISRIVGPDGRMLLPHELDPDTRAAVASFKIDEHGRIEYRFWHKARRAGQAAQALWALRARQRPAAADDHRDPPSSDGLKSGARRGEEDVEVSTHGA